MFTRSITDDRTNERTYRKHYASGQFMRPASLDWPDGIKYAYVYIIIVIIVNITSALSGRQVTDLSQMSSTSYVEVVDVADESVEKLRGKSATSRAVSCRVVTCRAAIM